MNYYKSALTGFGMSFIGTALCGAKAGTWIVLSRPEYKDAKFLKELLQLLLSSNDNGYYDNVYSHYIEGNCVKTVYGISTEDPIWNYVDNATYTTKETYNVNPYDPWCGKGWNFPKAFLWNNYWSIPTAILGATYHDYFGRSSAVKFNEYFGTDVSPYILDGAVFGTLGVVIKAAATTMKNGQPWIYSIAAIQGFLVGCTAAFGAYFGDEEPQIENDFTPLDLY